MPYRYRMPGRGHLLPHTRSTEHNVCAVVAGGLHLYVRGLFRHHDVRGNAERRRHVGDGLSVISARVGDHTSPANRFVQIADGIEGTTNLERSDRLQVLRLDPERTVGIGPSRRDQLSTNDPASDPVGRCLDILDCYQLHRSSVPNGTCRHLRFGLIPSSPLTIRSAITSSCGAPAR